MILVSARIGPFRSMNNAQTISIDPQVTVFVGMNEAGKTVILKALQKSSDAIKEDVFDVIEDYPRKDLTTYQKQHKTAPAAVTKLTYRLTESEVADLSERLHTHISPNFEFSVTHKYDNNLLLDIGLNQTSAIDSIIQSLSTDVSAKAKDAKSVRSIPEKIGITNLTPADETIVGALKSRIAATSWDNVVDYDFWTEVKPLVPKFLYFSDYDLLPGKMNLTELATRVEQAKTDPKQLKPKYRSVLALLRMADVAIADFANPGGYEELKAKIEGVSINLTDQVMEFWKQNESLEVEVDIKPDPLDEAPFNTGSNLYLRIKNRRHRGVSTPFDQRSRGFIWFFSFLVWFDSVQHQLEPNGQSLSNGLILLLDEPGLALHALAQADFLRYIDRLSQNHQVLFTTHSPFMVNADRLHQIRIVEDRKTDGTVVSDNLMGADPRTIFPLQAALGWTIAQNLFISRRNLLVEGPSELNYLQAVSGILEAAGEVGLRNDVTIVPTGGLDNLATFVCLLNASGLELAVLHDYNGTPEQKLTQLVRDKLLAGKSLLNASQFRDPANLGSSGMPSDIEDLFPTKLYLQYFNAAFSKQMSGKEVTETDLPKGNRVTVRLVEYLEASGILLRPSGGFNHYLVSVKFATNPPPSLDSDTAIRFRALFAAVNGIFSRNNNE